MNDFEIKDNGLVVREGLTPELWEAVGHQLATLERGYMWAIGDWLNAGERKGYMERGKYDEAAERFGLSKTSVRYAADIARQFPKSARRRALSFEHHKEVQGREDADELLDMGLTTKELREEKRRRDKAATPPLPKTVFSIIYADPPWQYSSGDQHGRESQETVLSTHYPSMSTQDICDLPISQLAAPDSLLFMWAVSPMLPEALAVINAWGFEYKASMVWDKVSHNVGHYVSVRHEFLLIAARGRPDKPLKLIDSVYSEKRTKHSKKPEYFRQFIDEVYPNGRRVELFRRGEAPGGWHIWGNEAEATS